MAAQLIGTIGQAGGAHGVGDQHGAFDSFAARQEGHRAGVNMDIIGDQLRVDRVEQQRCPQCPWLAVVQRAHRVVGVGGLADAQTGGAHTLLIGGVGMSPDRNHACSLGGGNQLIGPPHFGRQSDHAHGAGPQQFGKLGQIGRADKTRWLCAGVDRADIRPFYMYPQHAHASALLGCGRADRSHSTSNIHMGRGHRRGQKGRYPMLGKECGHRRQRGGGGIHRIMPRAAVDMQIDKAGQQRTAASIQRWLSRVSYPLINRRNATPADRQIKGDKGGRWTRIGRRL